MITEWTAVDDDTVRPPRGREVFTFNGRSWPHTERFTYRAGEDVHWRIINAASSNHPLHLHGFYFRVDSVGDAEVDTTYADIQDGRMLSGPRGLVAAKVTVKAAGAKPRPASMWGGRVVGRRGSRLRAESGGLPRRRGDPNRV